MSWSVNAVGKPKAVKAKLAEDFKKIVCSEPEGTIKDHIAAAILLALDFYPESGAVRVEASGSQSKGHLGMTNTEALNQLSVKIEPLWGFLE
jgi:hypothetical protein